MGQGRSKGIEGYNERSVRVRFGMPDIPHGIVTRINSGP